VLAHGVNRQNAFVLQTRCRFRFHAEPLHRIRRADMRRQNYFQRDNARGHTLACAIHDSHSTARHFIQQLVILNATTAAGFFRIAFFDCRRQQTCRAQPGR
jgi:hypothetical protein